jgi:hypothetical protein
LTFKHALRQEVGERIALGTENREGEPVCAKATVVL